MKRRDLLKSFAVAGALAGTGLPGLAIARTAREVDARQAFAASFEGVGESIGPSTVRFEGRLPDGLAGTLYRNGPARMRRGATAYRHWFDGDGMVQSLRIGDGRLHHHGRMIETDRSRAEAKAGRFLWSGFGTAFPDGRSITSPDEVNVGNIAILPLEGELLALWEAGSAWRIDPQTLATRGRKVFSEETDGVAFSAHPRVDPDGRIWSFGYLAGSGKVVLYDLDRRGVLKRTAVVEMPNADMIHDFAVTDRHLVFVLSPVVQRKFDDGRPRSFLDTLQWRSDLPTWLILVDKATLRISHRAELPNLFAFHYGNAWQDGRKVRIEVARTAPFDQLMRSITQATIGEPFEVPPLARPIDLVVDLETSRVDLEPLPLAHAEFPRFDPRHVGLRTDRLVMLARSESMADEAFGFNSVAVLDRGRQRVQSFDYGPRVIAEEHLFVPRTGGREGDGWVVGTTYDWAARRTVCSVFDARAVDAGPVAVARLPYTLPLGLHGQFVA